MNTLTINSEPYRKVTNEDISMFQNAISAVVGVVITPLEVSKQGAYLNFFCNAIVGEIQHQAAIVKIRLTNSGDAALDGIIRI